MTCVPIPNQYAITSNAALVKAHIVSACGEIGQVISTIAAADGRNSADWNAFS